jgi:hypothetical protein
VRVWRALGIAILVPLAAYFLIFHHFRCETDAEQMTAAALAIAGLAAAIKWA